MAAESPFRPRWDIPRSGLKSTKAVPWNAAIVIAVLCWSAALRIMAKAEKAENGLSFRHQLPISAQ